MPKPLRGAMQMHTHTHGHLQRPRAQPRPYVRNFTISMLRYTALPMTLHPACCLWVNLHRGSPKTFNPYIYIYIYIYIFIYLFMYIYIYIYICISFCLLSHGQDIRYIWFCCYCIRLYIYKLLLYTTLLKIYI